MAASFGGGGGGWLRAVAFDPPPITPLVISEPSGGRVNLIFILSVILIKVSTSNLCEPVLIIPLRTTVALHYNDKRNIGLKQRYTVLRSLILEIYLNDLDERTKQNT